MSEFFQKIPELVLFGCGILVVAFVGTLIWLYFQGRRVESQIRALTDAVKAGGSNTEVQRRDGLPLAALDEIRSRCEKLDEAPREWWIVVLDSHIEGYASRSKEDIEGWFLTEKPRQVLPFEIVVGKRFHSAIFGAFPGLLTGAGLTLTFVAILLALYGVHYDKTNTVEPISGIDCPHQRTLRQIRKLHRCAAAEHRVHTVRRDRSTRSPEPVRTAARGHLPDAIPYLPPTRVLLDIQHFAAKQKEPSPSVISAAKSSTDWLGPLIPIKVVPAKLAEWNVRSGVADKMQSEFRPTMQQMNGTLEGLKSAIVGLESQKQESVTGEIRALLTSLETSLVSALSKMGDITSTRL